VGTFVCALVLAAGPGPGGDAIKPVPGPNLTDKDRAAINRLLATMGPRVRPAFAKVARTIEEARLFAEVPARLNWQFEYDGWFIFSCRDPKGGPDEWHGILIVRRGTNAAAYYQIRW